MEVMGGTAASTSRAASAGPIESVERERKPVVDEENETNIERIGCCSKLAPREVYANNRERYIRHTLRELITYIIFLTVVCFVAYAMNDRSSFYVGNALQARFIHVLGSTAEEGTEKYNRICTKDEVWEYFSSTLLDGLYGNVSVPSLNGVNEIYFSNRLITLPRMRQVRVRNDSCQVHPEFNSMIKLCFDYFSTSSESKEPFGPDNDTCFQYLSEEQRDGSATSGQVSTYNGGGFSADLDPLDQNRSQEIIDRLHRLNWIDRATRALFVDFTVYNANVNLFCIARLLFEFPPTGGVVASYNFRPMKFLRYVSAIDVAVLVFECIFCVFIIYYLIEELVEMAALKSSYWMHLWSYVDLAIVVLSLVAIGYNIFRTVYVNVKFLESVDSASIDKFVDFYRVGYYHLVFNSLQAAIVFLGWIKLFKYLNFSKTMNQLSLTLSRCSKDLLGFGIMFFIIFLAFAQLGYLIFGTTSAEFCNFENSIFTLFRIILGDFDFKQLAVMSKVIGPIYFVLYVFFVFFVLLNMFLAIINETYSTVKVELTRRSNEFHLFDYMKRLLGIDRRLANMPKKCVDFHVWLTQMGFRSEDVASAIGELTGCSEDRPNLKLTTEEQRTVLEYLESKKPSDGSKSADLSEVSMQQKVDALGDSVHELQLRLEDTVRLVRASDITRTHRISKMNKLITAIAEAEDTGDHKMREKVLKMVAKELDKM